MRVEKKCGVPVQTIVTMMMHDACPVSSKLALLLGARRSPAGQHHGRSRGPRISRTSIRVDLPRSPITL